MKGDKSKSVPKRADNKLSVKKKAQGTDKGMSKAEKKAKKDPNMPKRPAGPFFIFMEDFRKQYKESHPENNSVAAVGRAGGEKWKSMSDADKAPFVSIAEKRKQEYNKKMLAYNKGLTEGPNSAEEDESDKSKSEIHDEDEDDEESGEGEDDDE